jgi:hypothetical protein
VSTVAALMVIVYGGFALIALLSYLGGRRR